LGATFVVGSQDGLKSIAASDFFVSYYQTALSPGEMLVAIRVPKLQPRQGDSFVPLSVGGTDVFNVVTVAGTVRFAEDGTISDCALVATGVAERPQHLAEVTARLVGTTGSEEAVNQAVAACDLGLFDPPSDVHASSEYRRAMVPVLARRAAAMAIIRARGDRQ
jgi:CO/xanthine dehydrogenase FAD-binding subunit